MADLQVITGNVELFVAPESTVHSNVLLTAPPGSPWVKLGGGNHRDGVVVTQGQTLNYIRTENSVHPKDAIRSESSLRIKTMLVDLSIETLSWCLHGSATGIVSVAASSSVIGTKLVNLNRTEKLPSLAFLVRTASAYPDGTYGNIYLPRAKVISDFETTLRLADAGLAPIEVEYFEHPTISPIWKLQTAPVSP